MTKRLAMLALMMILIVCLPVWALAAESLSIGDGKTETLSGTLSQGYYIKVDGDATLVLDHVTITADDYAALKIDGTGSLNIIFKGNNMLTNDIYGIFANSVEVTLTPGSADALLQIDNLANDDGGIIVDCLNLAEGAKVDAKSPAGIAVEASDLHVGADVVLNANGGWQGIDVMESAVIGRNARVNAHGSLSGLWFRGTDMIVEEGAEVNLSSDGAIRAEGSPLDISEGCFQIKSGAKVNATTDVTDAAIVVAKGSIIVEEGAALNGVNNRSDGWGLMMSEACSIQLNSENVTFTGGTRGAIGAAKAPGKIHLGPQIIAQHRNSAAEPWEEMTGNATQKRYFRTAKAAGSGVTVPEPDVSVPKTGDNSNVILWSALACISLFGMTMLVRKRKEA